MEFTWKAGRLRLAADDAKATGQGPLTSLTPKIGVKI